jgi:protein ImuB
MRHVISLWLPSFSTDRLSRSGRMPVNGAGSPEPLATYRSIGGRLIIDAVDGSDANLFPGQSVADARVLVPGLRVVEADPAADARALDDLADWCGRYTPWTATDGIINGQAGLWLDVTGCDHLFGGPAEMLRDLLARLRKSGYAAAAALAPTPGAASAFARFDPAASDGMVVTRLELRAKLRRLPLASLRLPLVVVDEVSRFGLTKIGDLYEFARGPLATRFGTVLTRRLDQALGRLAEPISPRRPVAPQRSRVAFTDPITTLPVAEAALSRLLDELCPQLERAALGVRRLELVVYRLDGAVRRLPVGTHEAVRDPAHLFRLTAPHLDKLGIDAGVEIMVLAAAMTEPLAARQLDFAAADPASANLHEAITPVIDRLVSRLGSANVLRPVARASHVPERSQSWQPSLLAHPTAKSASAIRPRAPRPIRLLARPEPVDDVVALVPDAPPRRFSWRGRTHRIRLADGPERIAPEWWRDDARTRDYYRVEDADGQRFWLYREGINGDPQRWYLHGFFA